jgi:hypothetical protein
VNPQTLELLLKGEYVCEYAFPDAWRSLENVADREAVNAWLGRLGMRLARVGDTGAFFMAPETVTEKVSTRLRAELRDFRDTYGPALKMLDFIRQSNGEMALCAPGERIQLVGLEGQVTNSTTLAAQLQDLVQTTIHAASTRFTVRENLRKLMDHLASDGYAILADRATETYQVTGKVEQLYAVLTFLDENKVIDDQEVHDQLELGDETGDAAADGSVGAAGEAGQ